MVTFLDPNSKNFARVDMSLLGHFDTMCEIEEYMLSEEYQLWDMVESDEYHKSQMLRIWWDSNK